MIQKVVSIYVKLSGFTSCCMCIDRGGRGEHGMLLQLAILPKQWEDAV